MFEAVRDEFITNIWLDSETNLWHVESPEIDLEEIKGKNLEKAVEKHREALKEWIRDRYELKTLKDELYKRDFSNTRIDRILEKYKEYLKHE